MTIGERIKSKRIELDMSQDELAKKCGYKSRSSIQKIESARDLPLRKVSLMARALGVTESYLMGWEDDEEDIEAIQTGEKLAQIALDNELLEHCVLLQSLDENKRRIIYALISDLSDK